jgi:branched-chain amino acid transport system substrate-binding protein
MKKTFIVIVLVLLAGCVSNKQEPYQALLQVQDTIKVGVVVTLSGDLAPYGVSIVRGCELAAEDINANGGILGKQLEIIKKDDRCRPDVAVKAAVSVVNKGADVIIGHLCSNSTMAANKIYKDAGLMVISPSSCNDDLTLSGRHPNFFRTIGYDDSQAQVMAAFAKHNLNARKVAIIHDRGAYGSEIMDRVRNNLIDLGGIQIVLFKGVDLNPGGYAKIAEAIKESNADLTIWGGYHIDGSKIVRSIKKRNVNTRFFGCDGILDDKFIRLAGSQSEGVYSTGPINTFETNALYKKIAVRHQKKYRNDMGTFTGNAYSALQMFALAANRAGSLDLEILRKEIRTAFVKTPVGEIRFDDNGDVLHREDDYVYRNGFAVFVVENQKFNLVEK